MSDIRLSQLTSLSTPASGDLLFINDISDTTQSASGSSKSITVSDLLQDYATQADLTTISGDLTTHISDTTTHGTTGDIVGTSDTQTLTNKTLTSPKINENVVTTITSTKLNQIDGLGGSVVGTSDTQTLTNKTLTSPKINSTTVLSASSEELDITDGGQTTEKVLNVQCKARAYLNTQQSNITDDTWTKVLLANENYDVGSDFDTSNSRFVAPVTGYYLVCGSVGWSTVTDKSYYAGIYVNGSLYKQTKVVTSTSGSEIIPVSDVVYLTSGQYIELYARHISAASTPDILAGSEVTNMAIHLLSI